MTCFRKIIRTVFLFSVFFLGTMTPLLAAPAPAPVAQPQPATASPPMASAPVVPNLPADNFDIMTNAVVADALSAGGKPFYIGNHSGLDGWLLVKDNQIQTIYMPADRKTLIVGAIFGSEGYDVTGEQINALAKANPAAAAEMTDMMKRQVSSSVPDNNPSSGFSALAAFRNAQHSNTSSTSTSTPAASSTKTNTAASLIPPGDRLLGDLQDAAGIDVGDPSAPVIYMVMDTNCPHCQATWRALRDAVFKKSLRIHLIPIGRNDDEERAGARLLGSSDPLNVWDKYVGGDKSQLAGDADPKLLTGLRSNHALVDSWSIGETPYTVYRSKTGEIKVLAGEPDHPNILTTDVGP